MFSVTEEALDIPTIHFTYITSQDLAGLKAIPFGSFDVVVVFAPFDNGTNSMPFRYDSAVHQPYLDKIYGILDNVSNIVTNNGTLYIHGLPQWLPYFSVHLDERGWQFKYWLALENAHPAETLSPITDTHEGILLNVRNKKNSASEKCAPNI